MLNTLPAQTAAARILHDVPGRLRAQPVFPGAFQEAASRVRACLEALPGVLSVRINPVARCYVVRYDGAAWVRRAILRTLSGPAPLLPVASTTDDAGGRAATAACAPTLPVATEETEAGVDLAPLAFSGLAVLGALVLPDRLRLPLTLVSIAPTLAHGAETLIRRGIKVPVLDALSLGVATLRGEYATACAARFLLELSETLEASTCRRSDALIRRLLRPNPDQVWAERDGEIRQVPFASLVVGDRVHVGAGEGIPVDGVVHEGAATVNQASVTGESLPIPKETGAPVLAGTVVEDGWLVVEAHTVGDATTTARITRFIQEGLDRRSPTQRLAEQLADRRVWISLGSGALVYALTRKAERLESLFLVDYSCALKLGAAVAMKSALYRAARAGILIRGGEALEKLAAIDTLVFDKTGTLTHGDMSVSAIRVFQPETWSRERFLATIASVEEHATHPVAAAVVAVARSEGMAHIGHEEVDFFIGHGLSSRIAEGTLCIGSRHYLEDHQGVSFVAWQDELIALEREGQTLLFVALDGEPLGVLALRDRIRPEAAGVLRQLKRLGIHQRIMITGDRRETAAHVARNLELDGVVSDADPEQKAQILATLKSDGRTVAFVGDGVNDGPALMNADLGIAMPRAADIARATADIVLLDDHLHGLLTAIAIARDALARVRRGFATAVGVNTGIMAGAAFGLLSPVASSVLHNGTTIALLVDAVGGGESKAPPPGAHPSSPAPRHAPPHVVPPALPAPALPAPDITVPATSATL